ncbi:Resolvase domain [Rhodospirillaceae bacterium LM-1]|nr:Resolvase domain [Rhodospirillaceae bacterium LM-1]
MAVALYARVSTARQAEKDLSIPDQLRQMQDWAKAHGMSIAKEYVEPGASATDDRRPVFQQMIADAMLQPSPFEAVLVHSQSRFFRDSLEFGLYERKLLKAGVKLISITQPMADDTGGEMIRKIYSFFDEYQSKENGKHTLRAMKENARRGFFNGSRAPFGYRIFETDLPGSRGKHKKRLEVDPVEALVISRIYGLYLDGEKGLPLGMKAIASRLNKEGVTLRGARWRNQKIGQVLSDPLYMGQGSFNRYDSRLKRPKPESEWIWFEAPAIITPEQFERVRAQRTESRPSPKTRSKASPLLLAGLLKCGHCGAGMTLATGKGGRYRYYRCTTKSGKGVDLCPSVAIPVDKLDQLVLDALAGQVLTVERLKAIVTTLKERERENAEKTDEKQAALRRELADIETGQARLYDAVEKGLIPMDGTLAERAQKLKGRREALLIEISTNRTRQALPLDKITPRRIEVFGRALKNRLLDGKNGLGKAYLRLMVDEIRIEGKTARIRGSEEGLIRTALWSETGEPVPRSIPLWRPLGDGRRILITN